MTLFRQHNTPKITKKKQKKQKQSRHSVTLSRTITIIIYVAGKSCAYVKGLAILFPIFLNVFCSAFSTSGTISLLNTSKLSLMTVFIASPRNSNFLVLQIFLVNRESQTDLTQELITVEQIVQCYAATSQFDFYIEFLNVNVFINGRMFGKKTFYTSAGCS